MYSENNLDNLEKI